MDQQLTFTSGADYLSALLSIIRHYMQHYFALFSTISHYFALFGTNFLKKAFHSLECNMGSSSFLFQHVYPIRLLEAAELLEADQRKHEGGHSKETSSKGFY